MRSNIAYYDLKYLITYYVRSRSFFCDFSKRYREFYIGADDGIAGKIFIWIGKFQSQVLDGS